MNDSLLLAQGIANLSFLQKKEQLDLFNRLGTIGGFISLSIHQIEDFIGRPVQITRWNPEQELEQAKNQLEMARRRSIFAVSYGCPGYPPLLRELTDPPLLLYYRGVLPDPEQFMVAVVGTRNPTGAGRTQAYRFGYELGNAGIPVVSGLARGIDSMAHRGNVEGGGKTVAVLGNGLDSVYPVSNRPLALRILETGGCLLSEYAPGIPPYKWHFPARNRIIAALGRATIVVEAPEHSGSLITAQYALDQGRDVLVGSVCRTSPRGGGGRNLTEQGAPYIDTVQRLFSAWSQMMNVSAVEE
ncbi:DNA-processing protein DprA [Gracilinema caldarium]|uniref:DNA protecting protein DprA n=1 Tax=Gracilinema caldarium (strain ATCC 51460 / DSM 7334 / H1) TaxID=744872 RepID=F8F1X4_GRAC1|nr:DNA-processing protein DprA [Gracilinema caldarium]AEJ19821.1 DNA protecting protein DprA [Gracilinema caldarium DSM 7334]